MIPLLGAGPSSGLAHFLRATFIADDVDFAHNQVLDSEAEMGAGFVGQLTILEPRGDFELLSNKLKWNGGSSTKGDGYYSQALARVRGRGLHVEVHIEDVSICNLYLGWDTSIADFAVTATMEHVAYFRSNVPDFRTTGHPGVFVHQDATTYEVFLVLGGFNASAEPWYQGAVGDYSHGMAIFIKGGVFATWTRLSQRQTGSTSTLYATLYAWRTAAVYALFADIEVPTRDLSAVLQPTNLSTFTAGNGTSLDAITPEVGGAWTEVEGDFDIQSNKANVVALDGGSGFAIAPVESGISDCIIDATIDPVVGHACLLFRYTDPTHFWMARWDNVGGDDQVSLFENDGGFTLRASAALVPSVAGEAYNIRIMMYGQQIDIFVNEGTKISYGSASFNETATKHGLFSADVAVTFDNFAVYPRTSSVYDAELDGV